MKNYKATIFCITISIINFIVSLIFISKMPEIIPTHFDFNGVVDGMGTKANAYILAFIPLIISLGMTTEIILRKKNYKNVKALKLTLGFLTPFFICLNWSMLFLMNTGLGMGEKADIGKYMSILGLMFGVLFIALGNYIPTIRQNRTLGIKLTWTLKNEECWNLTHRFAGKLMVMSGILYIITFAVAFFMNNNFIWIISLFIFILIITIVPTIYAYKHRNAEL